MKSRHIADPQIMKCHTFNAASFEEPRKASAGVGRDRVASLFLLQGKKDSLQLEGEGAGEGFFSASLGAGEGDGAALKIDQFHHERGLAQAASGVHADQKGQSHPFLFNPEGLQASADFLIGQLPFLGGRNLGNAKAADGIGLGHAALDGHAHELPKELCVAQSGVAPAGALAGLSSDAPFHKLRPVAKFNLGGVGKSVEGQPMFQMLPAAQISCERFGVGVMRANPSLHPAPAHVAGGGGSAFGKAGLRAKHLGLRCLHFAFAAKARRVLLPAASGVFSFQPPKRTVLPLVNVGHV